ncbi:cell division cycle protein 123 homolog [Caerostris extrusa]|uniref:Cell division cycle protein 123 homolog n=1 Tax=Caerostris extrusa TaxID=172846 RepID=A0AAV4MUZ6_CAEEX|nr:cell division cycle protein 123 homolog [Caerostris extrusa]
MKVEEVRKCSFQNWYKDFRKLTIKSIILPLPEDFVQFLLKDGLFLPKNSGFENSRPADNNDSGSEDEEETDWDDNDDDNSHESEYIINLFPQFLELDEKIKDAIDTLDGAVFPKLNWSCPRDSYWIGMNGSLRCTTLSDVYLLLKSSDFIVHDLTERFLKCDDFMENESDLKKEPFYLVLRRWTSIETSCEFRCFVFNKTLIGICQREFKTFYEHFNKEKNDIVKDIMVFFQRHIQPKFTCDNYIFDVLSESADALLFNWDELNSGSVKINDDNLPEFRYVEKDSKITNAPLLQYAFPLDYHDLCSGEDSFKFVDFLKGLKCYNEGQGQPEDDSDEEWKV